MTAALRTLDAPSGATSSASGATVLGARGGGGPLSESADAGALAATPSAEVVAERNARVAALSAEELVAWAAAEHGNRLVMSSSFGADSAVLLHMAARALPGIRVVFVDTGFLFPETWGFLEQLRAQLDLNVWVYRTRQDPLVYLRRSGEDDPTARRDVAACCAVNKNEPFDRAMASLAPEAWLRGVRSDQAASRADLLRVEWAKRYGCWAISPLLGWSGRDVHAYLKRHELPYHPLREEGYLSIGCNPLSCTRRVADGEDPRSGRWAGTGKLECGIHLTDSLDSAKL